MNKSPQWEGEFESTLFSSKQAVNGVKNELVLNNNMQIVSVR
jgi:hypothetical protein